MAYYITDQNGLRQRDSRDEEFLLDTLSECYQTISYYFDMGYGDFYIIVDKESSNEIDVQKETD